MVKTDDLKGLEFDTMAEYFEYIINSRTNGQRKQTKELFNALSEGQREDFETWYLATFHYEAADQETTAKAELFDLYKYIELI